MDVLVIHGRRTIALILIIILQILVVTLTRGAIKVDILVRGERIAGHVEARCAARRHESVGVEAAREGLGLVDVLAEA